jgi:N-acetylglucosaminyl-diphospho-decaprenol L-rhamnosyltransferase
MSISKQTLSAVIVTFKSDEVIDDCIQSIPDQIKIIVVDNSNDKQFKENLEKKYRNVQCILSSKNLGMGSGNNLGLKYVKTDYAIILNPDVILEKNTIQEIINESQKIDSFSILSPLSNDIKYPNYKIDNKDISNVNDVSAFKVKSVDGYAMVLNLKNLNQLKSFENYNYFDENFFMYLENDDLCKRLVDKGEKIFIAPKSKIKHLGAKAVNPKFGHEVELSRNWHWIWSKFYYNKKHFGFIFAVLSGLPNFISAILKFFIYLILNKNEKKEIYWQRVLGYINALLGKSSSYRPKIEN